jgi:hypothetical protein
MRDGADHDADHGDDDDARPSFPLHFKRDLRVAASVKISFVRRDLGVDYNGRSFRTISDEFLTAVEYEFPSENVPTPECTSAVVTEAPTSVTTTVHAAPPFKTLSSGYLKDGNAHGSDAQPVVVDELLTPRRSQPSSPEAPTVSVAEPDSKMSKEGIIAVQSKNASTNTFVEVSGNRAELMARYHQDIYAKDSPGDHWDSPASPTSVAAPLQRGPAAEDRQVRAMAAFLEEEPGADWFAQHWDPTPLPELSPAARAKRVRWRMC